MHMQYDIARKCKGDVPGFLGRLLFMQAAAIPVIDARVGILVALAFPFSLPFGSTCTQLSHICTCVILKQALELTFGLPFLVAARRCRVRIVPRTFILCVRRWGTCEKENGDSLTAA